MIIVIAYLNIINIFGRSFCPYKRLSSNILTFFSQIKTLLDKDRERRESENERERVQGEKIRECRLRRADAGSAGSPLQQNESFMPLLYRSRFYGVLSRVLENALFFLQTRWKKSGRLVHRLIRRLKEIRSRNWIYSECEKRKIYNYLNGRLFSKSYKLWKL